MSATSAHPAEAIGFAADFFGFPIETLVAHDRHQPLPSYRRAAAEFAWRVTNFSQVDVAEGFGRAPKFFSSVRRAMSENPYELELVNRLVAAWDGAS